MKKTISTPKTPKTTATKKVVVVKKTPAKKMAVKKVIAQKTTKKTVSKAPAKLPLSVTSDPEAFWLTDGQILNSLPALADAFAVMEKSVYQYHITKSHNDFAEWVEHVFADRVLAKGLKGAKTAKSARTIILKHITLYYV